MADLDNGGGKKILIVIFIVLGVISIVTFLKGVKEKKDNPPPFSETVEINSGTSYPVKVEQIKIPKAGFYYFGYNDGQSTTMYPLRFDFGDFSIDTDKIQIINRCLYFTKPCLIRIKYASAYVSNLYVKINVKEVLGIPSEVSLILFPKQYSDFTLTGQRGMTYKIERTQEFFYIDFFKDQRLMFSELCPGPFKEKPWNWITYPDNDVNLFFRDNYEIKFKSAEVPMLLTLKGTPQYHRLLINKIDSGQAVYLTNDGAMNTPVRKDKVEELMDTKVWLDKSDHVSVCCGNFSLATGDSEWIEGDKFHECQTPGFLKIKAMGDVLVEKIDVTRNVKASFVLQPEQENEEFEIFPGDVLSVDSDQRYYMDGSMEERGRSIYTATKEGRLKLKGSVVPTQITISVLKRRGM